MFEWLGLSEEGAKILGKVLIILAIVIALVTILCVIRSIIKSQKRINQGAKEEKIFVKKAKQTKEKNAKNNKKNKKVNVINEQVITKINKKDSNKFNKSENITGKTENNNENNLSKKETDIHQQYNAGNKYIMRLKNLDDNEKAYYVEIKNLLLSSKYLSNNLIGDGESFKFGNKLIAGINIKNEKLNFYIKLSKEELDQRFNNEPSEYKKYESVPMVFVLDKDVELRKSIASIERVYKEYDMPKLENYKEKSFNVIINRLIKLR